MWQVLLLVLFIVLAIVLYAASFEHHMKSLSFDISKITTKETSIVQSKYREHKHVPGVGGHAWMAKAIYDPDKNDQGGEGVCMKAKYVEWKGDAPIEDGIAKYSPSYKRCLEFVIMPVDNTDTYFVTMTPKSRLDQFCDAEKKMIRAVFEKLMAETASKMKNADKIRKAFEIGMRG
jgi:hypothetical protein